jgi:hypothetical protein
MTPDQQRLAGRGAAIVAAHLDGREMDKAMLVADLDTEEPRWLDTFLLTTAAALTRLGRQRRRPPVTLLASLGRRDERLYGSAAGVTDDWRTAYDLARLLLEHGEVDVAAATDGLDHVAVFAGSFSMAVAACEQLARGSSRTAAGWAAQLATDSTDSTDSS